jgi:hypothetical protein
VGDFLNEISCQNAQGRWWVGGHHAEARSRKTHAGDGGCSFSAWVLCYLYILYIRKYIRRAGPIARKIFLDCCKIRCGKGLERKIFLLDRAGVEIDAKKCRSICPIGGIGLHFYENVRNFVSGCEINSEKAVFSQADAKNITGPKQLRANFWIHLHIGDHFVWSDIGGYSTGVLLALLAELGVRTLFARENRTQAT